MRIANPDYLFPAFKRHVQGIGLHIKVLANNFVREDKAQYDEEKGVKENEDRWGEDVFACVRGWARKNVKR